MTLMKALKMQNGKARLVETDIPVAPHGSSLIKVEITGLCRTDVWISDGRIPVEDGRVIGHEFFGFIEKSDTFEKATPVAVFPFIPCYHCETCKHDPFYCPDKQQLGWHRDGSFAQYVVVPDSQIYPMIISGHHDMQKIAYAEPVAASLSAINHVSHNQKILVWGSNRIAELTWKCLRHYGYNVKIGTEAEPCSYDVIIETVHELDKIIDALKPCGTLIIKSRRLTPDSFSSLKAVNKNITMKAINHATYEQTLPLLKHMNFKELWGHIYRMDEAEEFLRSDDKEQKKVFLMPWL